MTYKSLIYGFYDIMEILVFWTPTEPNTVIAPPGGPPHDIWMQKKEVLTVKQTEGALSIWFILKIFYDAELS